MKRKLVIIRGASGSGKTTLAKNLFKDRPFWICEADEFFISPNGQYIFDPTRLKDAHQLCQARVSKFMFDGLSPIIVSNTSITQREVDLYLLLAAKYGYEVDVYRTKGPWDADTLFKRNNHGVPLQTIQRQIARYEPIIGEVEFIEKR